MIKEKTLYQHHPLSGDDIFEYFTNSQQPHVRMLYFLTKNGCFQCTMPVSCIDTSSNNDIKVKAKFQFIYQDYSRQKHNMCAPLHMRIAPNELGYHIIERIIEIDGNISDPKTFAKLGDFVENIFRIRLCHFCDNVYITQSPSSTQILCTNCLHLEKNVKVIQKQVRQAFTNPDRLLCRERLLREYYDLVS